MNYVADKDRGEGRTDVDWEVACCALGLQYLEVKKLRQRIALLEEKLLREARSEPQH